MKNRLEALRKQRGINQEQLADALEVSRQTIGSLENGRYNPDAITLRSCWRSKYPATLACRSKKSSSTRRNDV